jgi:hypothetical protein
MSSRLLASLLLTLASFAGSTSEPQPVVSPEHVKELERVCQAVLCRQPMTVRLMLDNGNPFETKFAHPFPIVQATLLTIFPGETLFIEGELKAGRVEGLKAVKANTKPAQTIVLRMWQEPTKPDTYLHITNPFPSPIKYRAGMMFPDSERVQKTSSCPVLSDGRAVYEHWPHAIFQLVLADFQVAAADAKCE